MSLFEDLQEIEQNVTADRASDKVDRQTKNAIRLVNLAVAGSIPFHYSIVQKTYYHTVNLAVYTATRTRLKNNYNRLRLALERLYNDGIVFSYTIQGTGRMSVKWFDGCDEIDEHIIEPILTTEQAQDISGPQPNAHCKLLAWQEYLNTPYTVNHFAENLQTYPDADYYQIRAVTQQIEQFNNQSQVWTENKVWLKWYQYLWTYNDQGEEVNAIGDGLEHYFKRNKHEQSITPEVTRIKVKKINVAELY